MNFYSEREVELLQENYESMGAKGCQILLELEGFQRTKASIVQKAHVLKLKSPLKNRSTCFKPNHTPWNKGKKFPQINETNAVKTQFKKGRLPHNTKQDGAISKRRDKSGRYYLHIRIALGKWVHYQRYLWEQANGPIPKGMLCVFKDGDTMNCALDNLELITRGENVQRNYNREKITATQEHLSDKMVAGALSHGDVALRKQLLQRPDILEAARAQMKLKRLIKNQKNAN